MPHAGTIQEVSGPRRITFRARRWTDLNKRTEEQTKKAHASDNRLEYKASSIEVTIT